MLSPQAPAISNITTSDNETYFSPYLANIFNPADNSRNASGFSTIILSAANKYVNKFSVAIEEGTLVRKISFSTYTFYARNIIIRFQPTDIIFPFHYFM
jgi:hypothetical protein